MNDHERSRERIEEAVGTPGRDFVGWLEHCAELGFVGVTVDGHPGVAHAAFTDWGGALTIAAKSPDLTLRAIAAIHCAQTLHDALPELGAEE